MNINTTEVRDGLHTGKEVWVCHYLRPDVYKNPLRNVPPTKVLIKCNTELPKNKRGYYSKVHFAPISNKGKVLARVISPVDNTGFRSRCGNELHVFTEEAECVEAWNNQIDRACFDLETQELKAAKQWKSQREALEATKVECDG